MKNYKAKRKFKVYGKEKPFERKIRHVIGSLYAYEDDEKAIQECFRAYNGYLYNSPQFTYQILQNVAGTLIMSLPQKQTTIYRPLPETRSVFRRMWDRVVGVFR